MIVCDASYLKALRIEKKQARRKLAPEVAETIDSEIEVIKQQGGAGPWYSTATIAKAFNVSPTTIRCRLEWVRTGFQGTLSYCGVVLYGSEFQALTVNKSTCSFRTWPRPAMATEGLDLAHHLERYKSQSRRAQNFIDRRRIEHGNDNPGNPSPNGAKGHSA